MKQSITRTALLVITVVAFLVAAGTVVVLSVGTRTGADTRTEQSPPRTMLSFDGSESEAIINAANDAILFGRWLERLQHEQNTATPPTG